MALTTTELGILGCFGRLGFISHGAAALGATGTDLWHRVDATGDQVFEDRLKGATSTLADLAIRTMTLGNLTVRSAGADVNALYQWVGLLHDYATIDLGYTSVAAWLAAKHFRVDATVRDLLECRLGVGHIPATSVHAPADAGATAPGLLLGTFTRGSTYAAGTDIVTTLYDESPILARVTGLGASDWTLSVTMKLADATTKSITQVVTGTGTPPAAIGDVYVLGQQAIGGVTEAGQKIVTCAATAQFKAGQKVVLRQHTGDAPDEVWTAYEVATIASVQPDTSITVVDNLLHAYTADGKILPCGIGVSACSSSGGTASDTVEFYPQADLRLKA